MALFHLWLRRGSKVDRDALIKIAVRRDRAGLPAFAAAREKIIETDPRLLKAAMRAAFSGYLWRWRPWDEDEAVQKGFEKARGAAMEQAVSAEVAWLRGGDEPAWPAFPDERPIPRRPIRMRVPGPVTFEVEDNVPDLVADATATIHVDSESAAQWLLLLDGADAKRLDWGGEIVKTYSDWTAKMNGWGLLAAAEVNRSPREWNEQFYVLFTAGLMDASSVCFDDQVKLVTDLPDQPFSTVAETLIHAADVLYFNDPSRQSARPVKLRRRMGDRTTSLRRWKTNNSRGRLPIDYDTGGVVAKLLLNTHDPFRGTRSYLVPAVADRLDPLLDPMRLLQSGGPTAFVALCTMNMLLVAPRARHLDFLLAAVESWFERLPTDAGMWITMGIGRKVVEWFEAAIAQDVGILATHPPAAREHGPRSRTAVGVGVADAHQLEKRVERAAVTDHAN